MSPPCGIGSKWEANNSEMVWRDGAGALLTCARDDYLRQPPPFLSCMAIMKLTLSYRNN